MIGYIPIEIKESCLECQMYVIGLCKGVYPALRINLDGSIPDWCPIVKKENKRKQ